MFAKYPGSAHDSRIFAESDLCEYFKQGLCNGYLLGDPGYALKPFLMVPYPDDGQDNIYKKLVFLFLYTVELVLGDTIVLLYWGNKTKQNKTKQNNLLL